MPNVKDTILDLELNDSAKKNVNRALNVPTRTRGRPRKIESDSTFPQTVPVIQNKSLQKVGTNGVGRSMSASIESISPLSLGKQLNINSAKNRNLGHEKRTAPDTSTRSKPFLDRLLNFLILGLIIIFSVVIFIVYGVSNEKKMMYMKSFYIWNLESNGVLSQSSVVSAAEKELYIKSLIQTPPMSNQAN